MSVSSIETGIYQHYKGNFYFVLGLAHHSETQEPLVVYMALYESEYGKNALWVRPYSMFIESIDYQGQKVPRFKKIKYIKGFILW